MPSNTEIQIQEIEKVRLPTKRALLLMIALSVALDYMMMSVELPLVVITLGGSVVVEEIIELLLSNQLAKHGLQDKLSLTDKAIGFIPIPGVTAIAVRCIKELIKGNYDKGDRAYDEIEVVEFRDREAR